MLIYILSLAVFFLLYMRLEASRLSKERILLKGSFRENLKIIQLSDIHIKYLKIDQKRIRRIIEEENPDLIVFTGDYADDAGRIYDFIQFAAFISSGYTAYGVNGNHDLDTLSDPVLNELYCHLLKKAGVTLLVNQTVTLEKNGIKYNLTGIDDVYKGNPQIERAFSQRDPLGSLDLVISHNPDVVFRLDKYKVDLLMCGHFHGGQIWTPFGLEFRILRKEKLPSMGITRGFKRFKDINLYISRGLGNVCFPLRFLSVPEITIFEFRGGLG